ncbi:hypothetical protein [Helicobacter marmotae]|uniref:Uncharacterized protein n=1 Tax=Helicobacter marmotae TaxID=152490 RepID=A0A3D8I5X5_9HELI|nr:hypothetical protein [Helicobacter marmotae]RDU60553.1 hypothetical protein CQA63_03160 [Helicobacter marmotae]
MAYLIFILTLLLLVALILLFSKYKQYLSTKNKTILGISFLLLAGLIGLYNILQEQESEYLNALKSAFMRDESIECTYQGKSITINQQNFNFSNGTMSFQGKSNASHIIIPLQDCTIADKNSSQ